MSTPCARVDRYVTFMKERTTSPMPRAATSSSIAKDVAIQMGA